ncbi:MAG: nitroreductase [Planctomycetes bacterium]|nr:nitroreductase [Planctomycetota bacterium]
MGFFSRRRPAGSSGTEGSGPTPPKDGEHARQAPDPLAVVRAYHVGTHHDFQRYAAGPLDLDWKTQPDPFRRFAGAELVPLERVEPGPEPRFEPAYHHGAVPARAFDRSSISQLFYDSFAISAWKQYGEARWALRCNPSSGNLHPTEAYLIAPPLDGWRSTGFVAHYASDVHALEVRAELPEELVRELTRGFTGPVAFVGLTSIAWREAWKYGERAFRYCQLDLGHALGALAVAAAGLGWRARRIDALSSDEVAALCGVDAQRGPEREEPETWVALQPADAPEPELALGADSNEWVRRARALAWRGRPNDLSSAHVDWDALEAIAIATRKPRTLASTTPSRLELREARDREPDALGLRQVVRRRRSATGFDPTRGLAREGFLQTLSRTLAGRGRLVTEVVPGAPRIDLVCFVHRVAGLDSGIYLLLRDPARRESWRHALGVEGELETVDTAPFDLALVRLRAGDVRATARSLACHQEIASDGCFSVAAFADLESELGAHGPRVYRELHWEAGFVVHLLYLEAEALGLSGTGIGCYFDQPTRGSVGLGARGPVCLYQFACGARVDDPRLTTLAGYGSED